MKVKKHAASFLLAVMLIICMILSTGYINAIVGPSDPPGLTRPPRPRTHQVYPATYIEDLCINCLDPSGQLCTTCLYFFDDVQP